jgi:hypothetical protein
MSNPIKCTLMQQMKESISKVEELKEEKVGGYIA